MSVRGQAATSQQAKPGSQSQTGGQAAAQPGSQSQTGGGGGGVGASSVMLQSAMQYNCSVVSSRKPDGKSMMGGPMDKKEMQRQSLMAKQETSKLQNEVSAVRT